MRCVTCSSGRPQVKCVHRVGCHEPWLLDPASPSAGEAVGRTRARKGDGSVLVGLLCCSQLKSTDLLFYSCRVQRVVHTRCSDRSTFGSRAMLSYIPLLSISWEQRIPSQAWVHCKIPINMNFKESRVFSLFRSLFSMCILSDKFYEKNHCILG